MKIIIFGKAIKEKHTELVQELLDVLHEEGIQIVLHEQIADVITSELQVKSEFELYKKGDDILSYKINYLVSLGGDGTILDAATIVNSSGVPILGVNLGRMGFLANVEKQKIRAAIIALKKGQYNIDKRSLISMESNPPLFGDYPFALNDCTLLKRDTSSMIVIRTYINGEFLNAYWADGLILSTPTGSTGYSLSCGGPIIFPNSGNFVITPVAPHNLNVRPIVIPDSSVISFEVEGRADSFLCTLDSRFETINTDHQLAVKKCPFTINLINLFDRNFLQTIREKLTWGQDLRNYANKS